jgi:hypothetical protein
MLEQGCGDLLSKIKIIWIPRNYGRYLQIIMKKKSA